MTKKVAALSMPQFVALVDWFRPLLKEFQETRPSIEDVRKQAETDLNMPISEATIRRLRKEYGQWKTTKAAPQKKRHAGENLRTITRALVRFMKEVGYVPSPEDQANIRRIVEMPVTHWEKSSE